MIFSITNEYGEHLENRSQEQNEKASQLAITTKVVRIEDSGLGDQNSQEPAPDLQAPPQMATLKKL